jgi:hypothetical protein
MIKMLAVCGRAGAEVVQVPAPDPADVTGLGVRASDGGSIYRPPNEERYTTLAHLDAEEQILAGAKRAVPQLVSHAAACATTERAGLTGEQLDAVAMMLTGAAATTVLIAPAGAGKSYTMSMNRRRSLMMNLGRPPDGGASSKQISRQSDAPSTASTRPPSTPGNPGRLSAHPSRIPSRRRRRARRISRCLRSPRGMTGQHGWTSFSRGPTGSRSVSRRSKPNGRTAATTPRGSSGKPRPSPKPNSKPKPTGEPR